MKKSYLSAALVSALLALSVGSFTSCKSKNYDSDVKDLQGQIDDNHKTLQDKVTVLNSAMDKANTDLENAKTAVANAQSAAEAAQAAATQAAAQAKVEAIAEATRLTKELQTLVEDKVSSELFDQKMKDLDASMAVITGDISTIKGAQAAIKLQIAALDQFKTLIEGLDLAKDFPTLKSDVAGLVSDLQTANSNITNNSSDITKIKADLTKISGDISKLQSGLDVLSDLLSKRLTSLVFAPTTYINGVEAIVFSTLEYTPWIDLQGDAADGTKVTSINDGKTSAYYYANPSSISLNDLTGVSLLFDNAENFVTKSNQSPIISATIESVGEYGKMKVNLKKNTTESLNLPGTADTEKFIIAALNVNIKTTAEEEKNGMSPTVTSNWVRLAENSLTPYIHNIYGKGGLHFNTYKQINDGGSEGVSTTAGQFILDNVAYDQTLDLNEVVKICDNIGGTYDPKEYNLAFEFDLVDYNLQASGEELTNQKEFAKIVDGVISSQSRDGQANNRSAIGREPMIRIILRNVANNEIVDVKYTKIKWVSKKVSNDLGLLDTFAGMFGNASCDAVYTNLVGTQIMNDLIYAKLDMSKEQFHGSTTLDANVYATFEDAVNGVASLVNGSVEEIAAPGSTTTFNIEWNLPIAMCPITAEEYVLGKAHRNVFARYITKNDPSVVYIFELTLDLDVQQMVFDAGYNQSFWSQGSILTNTNKDKVFQINPALTDDATYGIAKFFDCQFIGDMLKGYNSQAGALTSATQLVDGSTEAKFVFDAERVVSILGMGWTVTENGKYLNYNGEKAAMIDATVISLYENPVPTVSAHGLPTPSAISLLGKSVPVKLVASYCGAGNNETEHDYFLVNFIKPLSISVVDANDSFEDLLTGGSTISVANLASIKENFGLKRTVWANGAAADATLGQWYNVENVVWDLSKAKTNLKRDGHNIIISNDNLASNWSEFSSMYRITASPSEIGATELTFHNNSGVHMQQGFTISIPVYARTKWSSMLYDSSKMYVEVDVMPGSVRARRMR